jgi:mono/diheme cytochrome c family protein
MVPWKDQLKPGEIDAVTAYVASLRGTHPSNPKPPQGTKASAADISLATISR